MVDDLEGQWMLLQRGQSPRLLILTLMGFPHASGYSLARSVSKAHFPDSSFDMHTSVLAGIPHFRHLPGVAILYPSFGCQFEF